MQFCDCSHSDKIVTAALCRNRLNQGKSAWTISSVSKELTVACDKRMRYHVTEQDMTKSQNTAYMSFCSSDSQTTCGYEKYSYIRGIAK